MKEPQSGKASAAAERAYEAPKIEKRKKLAEVVEGVEPRVTDGAKVKGGCFEQST